VPDIRIDHSVTREWQASEVYLTRDKDVCEGGLLAARGESPALHRGRRGARLARRDDREYREYLREEQRS
jgi:hypothetical protein